MYYEKFDLKIDEKRLGIPEGTSGAYLKLFFANLEGDVVKYSEKRKRPTVLIIPGGGYSFVSEREAEPIAMRFLAKGYNAAVLYYTCAPARYPLQLIEALTAIRHLRSICEEYHGAKNMLFVCGFSAGGHLAASAGLFWNGKDAENYFEDTAGLRPDGLILAYPVITSEQGNRHLNSFRKLLGDKDAADPEKLAAQSLEKHVTEDAPPTFIWSTFDDKLVPCENTMCFAKALREHGVPFEMHIYEKGWHATATGDRVTVEEPWKMNVGGWIELASAWIDFRT